MGAVCRCMLCCSKCSEARSVFEEGDYVKGCFELWPVRKGTFSQNELVKLEATQSRLAVALASLSRSEFWETTKVAFHDHWMTGQLPKVDDVVCLCLGSLEDIATIHQLALLVLLLRRLDIKHENCAIYDPCHTQEDIDILKHLGFAVLTVNDQARIRVQRMTLFYMPYGEYHLTKNLLEANRSTLHFVSILGNSLSWVSARGRAPTVREFLAFAKETSLIDTFAQQARMHLVSLLSEAFGQGLRDLLGCTLTTFPAMVQ